MSVSLLPTLGKRLTSPMKKREPRAKRARKREENKQLYDSVSPAPTSSRSVTPSTTSVPQHTLLTAAVDEQLQSEYSVHELPSECGPPSASCTASYASSSERDIVVDRALIARIEFFEAENESLKKIRKSPHPTLESS